MEFKKIQTVASTIFIGLIITLFIWMVYPYLLAIFWAAIIATIFYPLYTHLRQTFKNRRLAAALTLIIVILIVLIPLSAVFGLIVQQAVNLYFKLTNPYTIASLQKTFAAILTHPTVQDLLGDAQISERLQGLSTSSAKTGLQWLKVGSQSTITAVINIFIMLYTLYYFLLEGENWLKKIMRLLPFGDVNEKFVYAKFVSAAKATLKGTLLIGLVQGTVGGIIFVVVGIPAAALWGLIMIILSIIPAVGPFMVTIPATIYLFVTGQTWQGFVALSGSLLISILDNLLRPPLVGRDTEMHPMMVLFATIGGIGLFGISGVVIGPIVASVLMALLSIYEHRFKKHLDSPQT